MSDTWEEQDTAHLLQHQRDGRGFPAWSRGSEPRPRQKPITVAEPDDGLSDDERTVISRLAGLVGD